MTDFAPIPLTPGDAAFALEARVLEIEVVVAQMLTQARLFRPSATGIGAMVFNVEPEVARAFTERAVCFEGSRLACLVRPDPDRPGRMALDVRVRQELPR